MRSLTICLSRSSFGTTYPAAPIHALLRWRGTSPIPAELRPRIHIVPYHQQTRPRCSPNPPRHPTPPVWRHHSPRRAMCTCEAPLPTSPCVLHGRKKQIRIITRHIQKAPTAPLMPTMSAAYSPSGIDSWIEYSSICQLHIPGPYPPNVPQSLCTFNV